MIKEVMVVGKRTFDCGVAMNPSLNEKIQDFKGKIKKKTGDFHPLIVLAIGIIGFGFVILYKLDVVPQMNNGINTMGSQISTFLSAYTGAGTGSGGSSN